MKKIDLFKPSERDKKLFGKFSEEEIETKRDQRLESIRRAEEVLKDLLSKEVERTPRLDFINKKRGVYVESTENSIDLGK